MEERWRWRPLAFEYLTRMLMTNNDSTRGEASNTAMATRENVSGIGEGKGEKNACDSVLSHCGEKTKNDIVMCWCERNLDPVAFGNLFALGLQQGRILNGRTSNASSSLCPIDHTKYQLCSGAAREGFRNLLAGDWIPFHNP